MPARFKQFPRRLAVQLSLLFIGITLLVVGVVRGEALLVLKKAILVCLECIGIG